MSTNIWQSTKNVLFDLDGCIWFSGELAVGAVSLVETLQARSYNVFFLTNRTTATSAGLAQMLTELGIPTKSDSVVAPLTVINRHPALAHRKKVIALGHKSLVEALISLGFQPVQDPTEAEAVIVGNSLKITLGDLALAAQALERDDIPLIALNLDARVPTQNRTFTPGVGAIAAFLTTATNVRPQLVGKPSPFFFGEALRQFKINASETIMIGDSLDSDIIGGKNAGLHTVHVMQAKQLKENQVQPDVHVPDLVQLEELIVSMLPAASATNGATANCEAE